MLAKLGMLVKLAQFAPTIYRFIGMLGAPKKVEDEITKIAQDVTGTASAKDAEIALASDPDKAQEFRLRILAHEQKLEELYFRDVNSARNRDSLFVKDGRRNWRADFMTALAVAVIVFLVWIIWKDQNINEYVKGVFTFVLGRFAGYLDNIYAFEFGSTRSSKQKDETIASLSGDK